jgi:RNA polymerase sigma factor (TIGR02999 family)
MRERQPARHADVTGLLRAARGGDGRALDRLVDVVYGDLRDLAARQLRREGGDRTLHATGLVHEAYVKLAGGGALHAEDRVHFLSIAARAMRQVLVDHARRRRASRRGGGWVRTTLSGRRDGVELDPVELLALDEALESLEARQRQIVELRFFGGLEEREVAEVLGVSERTVRREWVKARARLYRVLYVHSGSGPTDPEGSGATAGAGGP